MKKLFLLLVAVLSVSLCAFAQRTVQGTVVDDAGEPLIGASVVPVGASKGVVTDADGNFIIQLSDRQKAIQVSMVGFKTQTVQATSSRMLIELQSAVETKDEVIIVAYGKAKRSAYTGSAGVVKSDQLEQSQSGNVVNALSGRVAGVQMQSSYGAPGSVGTVLIRGVGSINAGSTPLYVVDGMPMSSSSDIAAINPNDIAEMTVLKDAASTALYGARGANGVILITTKSGSEGNAKVTVDVRLGSNSRSLERYETINDPRQYIETLYKAHYYTGLDYYGAAMGINSEADAHRYANDQIWSSIGYQTWTVPNGQDIVGKNGKFNPNATPGYVSGNYMYKADDWYDNTIMNGLHQEYNMSITGGTQKLKYFVSGSYLGDEGIIKASAYDRFTTRANVEYQAKSWLKVGTNLSYTYQDTKSPGDQDLDASTSVGNAFNAALNYGPVYPMYIRDTEGNIRWSDTYNRPIYDYGDGKDYGWGRTPTRNTYSSSNPLGDLQYDSQNYLADVFNAKWFAQITPLTDLNIIGTAGYMVGNTRFHYVKNPLYGSGAEYKGQSIQAQDRARTINLNLMATYSRQFGDHGFDVMVSAENSSYNLEDVEATGQNLYNPTSPYVNNTIDQRRGYGYSASLVHRGFLGRLNYNYAGKYYVSASIRRDGSSRFHKDNRWGTFWAASAGWDIAKENFLKGNNVVDMLKFKFSFGQTGNDNIGSRYLAWDDQYQITGSDGIWSDGTLAYKGNQDITWETSNSLNTGFDFSFFKGKLYGSVEYFQRETNNMLFYVPTAPSLGYSSIPMNNGKMRNAGVEIDLNWRAVNTKDITVDFFGNLTFGWNKVLKLNKSILNTHANWQGDSEMGWLSGSRIFFEGKSMYNYWLVEYAGVNKDENAVNGDGEKIPLGDALYWSLRDKTDSEGNVITRTYIDKNGEEVTENVQEEYKTNNYSEAYRKNRKETGNVMPKGYGGFGVNINAYGFDFSASFAYQFGGKIIDSAYQNYMSPFTAAYIGQAVHKDLLDAWSPDNANSDIPRLATDSQYSAANSTSTRFYISSNYLSLNNVTLGYTLPLKWTSRISLNEVRFYCTAENVALWSKRKGLDPRQGFGSSDNSTYSPIRTISGGVRVSF